MSKIRHLMVFTVSLSVFLGSIHVTAQEDNNGETSGGENENISTNFGTVLVGSKDEQVVAPSVAEKLPAVDLGFDGENHYLIAGLGQGRQRFGFSLYVSSDADDCEEDCEEYEPALLTDDNQLIQPSRLIGELSSTSTADGLEQLTLDGKPLYLRTADTAAGQTDGADGNWQLATVELEPLPALFQFALQTPSNMPLSENGFQFDINDDQVTWAFGPTLANTSKTNVTFVCSPDQMVFFETDVSSGSATVPSECDSENQYWYFFQYELANAGAGKFVMDNTYEFDEATAYRYTALFVNDGTRLDLSSREEFNDVGANWMRFRHPRSYDGVTEAIRDATHNFSRIAELARYSLNTTETTNEGSVTLVIDLNMPISNTGVEQGLVRLEGIQNGAGEPKLPTWRFNFEPSNNQTTYTIGGLSYGQNISFEMTGVVGRISSQTYNTFQYYTVGKGFHSPIGDPRLSLVGKGGTHMVFNRSNVGGEFKNGHIGAGIHDAIMEKAAIFTQHLTTIRSPSEVDDFLWGHHLFHGVKLQLSNEDQLNRDGQVSQDNLGSNPGDTGIGREIPEVKEGVPVACGDCHYRDGRGSNVIETANGARIAPPTFGVGLLQYIDGREAGFGWSGEVPTVREQIISALINDHQIDPENPEDISPANLELISKYTEYLTVPARFPGVYDDPDVVAGDQLFNEINCDECHTPIQRTSVQAPEAFRNLIIRPYTDMKIHAVAGGNFRTSPLWGLGRNIDLLENNNKLVNGEIEIGIALDDGNDQEQIEIHHMRQHDILFLHDGRASTVEEAILLHGTDGDAAAQITAFSNLSSAQRQQIVKFLRSL